jgi:microcystin-dependent protein
MKKILLIILLLSSAAYAQDRILNYQGVLLDNSGQPVSDGTYSAVFELYDVETAGSSLWNDTGVSISTVNGAFSVRLGSGDSPIPESVDFTKTLWLEIQVNGSAFNSRVRIDPDPTAISVSQNQFEEIRSLADSLRNELSELSQTLNTLLSEKTDSLQTKIEERGVSVPIGTILAFAGEKSSIPEGWLYCDGRAVSRTEYSELFSVIDEFWGEGDNSTEFNLPELRGYFLRGVADGETRAPDRDDRFAKNNGNSGDAVGSYQGDIFTSHTHGANSRSSNANAAAPFVSVGSANIGGGSISLGNSGGNETRPINAYVYYIIKAK